MIHMRIWVIKPAGLQHTLFFLTKSVNRHVIEVQYSVESQDDSEGMKWEGCGRNSPGVPESNRETCRLGYLLCRIKPESDAL